MRIIFLGVGEACDERYPNTAVLVQCKTGPATGTLLLDCGFSVPQRFFTHVSGIEDLDCIWLSHFHGDHFFGLPPLLLRLAEGNRRKALTIAGPEPVAETVHRVMELAYPGFFKRLGYRLDFAPVPPGIPLDLHGFIWQTAASEHSPKNLALRLSPSGKDLSLFYSGDGKPTPETLTLARDCSLLIHEAFQWQLPVPGHGSIRGSIDFAREARAARLALVHIQRNVRRERLGEIQALLQSAAGIEAFLPEPDLKVEL